MSDPRDRVVQAARSLCAMPKEPSIWDLIADLRVALDALPADMTSGDGFTSLLRNPTAEMVSAIMRAVCEAEFVECDWPKCYSDPDYACRSAANDFHATCRALADWIEDHPAPPTPKPEGE